MATSNTTRHMQNRGLLTADDRAFFEGDKDVDDPMETRRQKRYNVRQRIERLSEDLDILREAGENDLVSDFYDEVGRLEQIDALKEQVERLEQQFDQNGDE